MKPVLFIVFMSLMNIPQGFNDRRIIVIADSEFTGDVKRQIDTLKEKTGELEERRLAIFTVIDGEMEAVFNPSEKSKAFIEENKANYTVGATLQVYLIGLDKTVKQTFRSLVQPEQIFEIVDDMPMRKAEMRKN
ncbi:DUF4174 domain-containing protein [Psychroflexus sp. YR1-1]|uniref:DUF4174 domain-containing protein n=1 Tax=Psychroflexus aurantiacus TaxID=2709310 RepID=A0A6B3R6Y0_9FLAO|nr:DUF4174 domain-containing protein [Psychroflexus aurantiacus]NEV93264.1 DUF4174 domain-containing protein [Psychroflexus aurantiacus]